MTRDDSAWAVDGGTDGELDEVDQYLANRVTAGHIGHGGGHVVGGVLRFRWASFGLTEVYVVMCSEGAAFNFIIFQLDISIYA